MIPQRAYVDFPKTNRQHFARDAEVFNGARQGKRIRRDDAHVANVIHHGLGVEVLRVNGCRKDIGENLEFIRHTDIVSIR